MPARMLGSWTTWGLVLLLGLQQFLGSVNSIKQTVLPDALLKAPPSVDPTEPMIDGIVSPQAAVGPRVTFGYLSDKDWALIEFICMTYASWAHVVEMGKELTPVPKLDLLVFSAERWAPVAAKLCPPLDLDSNHGAKMDPIKSQCWTVSYPEPPEEHWHGYPFANNVHFLADPRVAAVLGNYGLALKTDFDTFLTPSLLLLEPPRFVFGVQKYVVVEETHKRLLKVASSLGLQHHKQHNLGPTWFGDARTVQQLGNRSLSVMHHIVSREFEQKPGGGIKQDWLKGEGWPEWNAGIAAMYATEITANHWMEGFESDEMFDLGSDSDTPLDDVHHIHCRHGSDDFDKFQFLRHHYDHVDLAMVDPRTARGYAMKTALLAWRQLVAAQQHQAQRQAGGAAGKGPRLSKEEL